MPKHIRKKDPKPTAPVTTTPEPAPDPIPAPTTVVPIEIVGIPAPSRTALISENTPIRLVGDCAWPIAEKVLRDANSPMLSDPTLKEAMGGFTIALLCIAAKETQYGKTASGRNNAFGILDPSGFVNFESWSQGAIHARMRLADYGFKGGVYSPPEISVKDFITVYQGGPLCRTSNMQTCANGETRQSIELSIRQFVERANRIIALNAGPTPVPPADPPPSGEVTFGRVPPPLAFVPRIIPSYNGVSNGGWVPAGYNSAWNDLGPRQFRGFCLHVMEGHLNGTDNYFRNEARMSALTDFGIGSEGWEGQYGQVYQWNSKASRRAPWANGSGGTGGEEEDGPAFIARYGINAVNRDLRSIELSGWAGRSMPEDQIDRCVELMAWLADQEKVPYTQWPMLNGLTLVYGHWEFSPKPCPGPWVRNRIGEIIERVGDRLQHYQEGG